MELSTAAQSANGLTGRELLPGLQDENGIGMMGAELGSLPRGAMLLRRAGYTADVSATTDADPGAGKVRWNHATQASATQLYIDDADASAGDHSALWATLLSGGYAYLRHATDLTIWQQWSITSVTDAAGYLKIGVTLVASNGSFANGDSLQLSLQQPNPSPGVDRNVVTALAISSGIVAVDCSLGDYFTLALNANVTGWTLTNVPPGCSLMIEITQDSTPRTVAWPTGTKWAGGTAGAVSTASGAKDMLALTTFNTGSTWRATLAKAFA